MSPASRAPGAVAPLVRTDGDRLWRTLAEMGRVGATPGGGVARVALTEADRAGRDLFVSWCEASGYEVSVDRLGSIHVLRPGRDRGRPVAMTGSHLDSQPLGGRFDGAYGVLAGLEVLRSLDDAGVETEAGIEVVDWTDEEGVRFDGLLASGTFAGIYTVEEALARTDRDGVSLADALAAIGYAGTAPVAERPAACFVEAHIEQGPILEAEGIPIGVVLGAQGQRCFEVSVDGEEGHAGTLPMSMRRDALLGAARMIDAVSRVSEAHDPPPVITVGAIAVRPGARNTIAGRATFSIDSRHPDDGVLARIEDEMRAACEAIARRGRLGLAFERTSGRPAVRFDPECVALVRETAARLGLGHRDLHSGAGHDACQMARAVPTAMIFIPCEGGISHNERENATAEDARAGCDVLANVLLARAGFAGHR